MGKTEREPLETSGRNLFTGQFSLRYLPTVGRLTGFSKIRTGCTFLVPVPAHPHSPGQGPLNGSVVVCIQPTVSKLWLTHRTLTQPVTWPHFCLAPDSWYFTSWRTQFRSSSSSASTLLDNRQKKQAVNFYSCSSVSQLMFLFRGSSQECSNQGKLCI